MSVDKVLALAKTITTIQIKLPLNKEVYTQTMLMARHQKIAKLFDEDFWVTRWRSQATIVNNNKSNITPLHIKNCRPLSVLQKKLSTIVCIVVKTKNIKPSCFLKRQYWQCSTIIKATLLHCTKKLSTIVCIVVKTKKYKASCFLKRQYWQCSTIIKATLLHCTKNCRPLSVLSLKLKI